MSHLFGVGLNIEINKINTQFKMQIAKKGGIGIRSLGVIFRRMDVNGNRKLDAAEFTQALSSFGLFPSKVEIQALMKHYDTDGDGNITYEEFLRGLREPLSARRKDIVLKAFRLMDKDGRGTITVADIEPMYDVSQNQDFIDGTMTKEQILEAFLSGFEGLRGDRDGVITQDEWVDYYTDLSMSIDNNEYFVRMMESVWGICEESDAEPTSDTVKHLTKIIRQKLLSFSNSQSDEYVLRTIFTEFDRNNNGVLSADELQAMLIKLQISCDRRYLQELLAKFDRNGNGVVEFDEFVNYIIHDPYQ